jgi:hypothetical protein
MDAMRKPLTKSTVGKILLLLLLLGVLTKCFGDLGMVVWLSIAVIAYIRYRRKGQKDADPNADPKFRNQRGGTI